MFPINTHQFTMAARLGITGLAVASSALNLSDVASIANSLIVRGLAVVGGQRNFEQGRVTMPETVCSMQTPFRSVAWTIQNISRVVGIEDVAPSQISNKVNAVFKRLAVTITLISLKNLLFGQTTPNQTKAIKTVRNFIAPHLSNQTVARRKTNKLKSFRSNG